MKILSLGLLRGGLEIKSFMRRRESVVFTLFFPVLLLFIFGSVFKNTIAPGVTFSQYFIAGMVASGLVNTGFQQLAINIPIERDYGTLKRLRGALLSPISFFIGKGLVVLVAMAIQIFFLLLFGALFFHLHLPHSATLWLRFTWLVLLGSACSTVLGIAMATVIKSGRGAAAVVSPLVVVLFPLKWLTQGMRSVFLPQSFASQEITHHWEIGKIALVLSVWLIIGTALAVSSFRWSDQ